MHNFEDRVACAYSRGIRRGKRRALTPLVRLKYRCQGFSLALVVVIMLWWML